HARQPARRADPAAARGHRRTAGPPAERDPGGCHVRHARRSDLHHHDAQRHEVGEAMSAIEQSTQQEPIRRKSAAARRASRVRTTALWMLLVLLATAAAYIFWGRDRLPAIEVLQVLGGESVPGTGFILMEDRLPRLVVGALAGAGLGLSGALFQR